MTDRQDTAVRAPWASGSRPKLSRAADEHRANAQPESAKAAKRPPSASARPRHMLRLTRIDPWSVMKTSFLLAVASASSRSCRSSSSGRCSPLPVWDSSTRPCRTWSAAGTPRLGRRTYVGMSRVMGFTILVACVDVILITAIATLSAFLYNMSASTARRRRADAGRGRALRPGCRSAGRRRAPRFVSAQIR